MYRRTKIRNLIKNISHWKRIAACLMAYDVVAVLVSYFGALWLRFDCRFSMIPDEFINAYIKFMPFFCIFVILIFYKLRLYRSIWRFASYSELERVIKATIITAIFHIVFLSLYIDDMPISYYVFGIGLQFVLTLGARLSYRFVLLERRRAKSEEKKGLKNILLIGAGEAGHLLLRDINSSNYIGENVIGIIDDNENKWGRYIENVKVLGGRESIIPVVKKYNVKKIYVVIPSATAEEKRDILNICKETRCELKNLPSLGDIVNTKVKVSSLKDVAVEDLLGREPIKINMREIFDQIEGKVMMVTGGGGSIGQELVRQIAACKPKCLVIFDMYENGVYDVQQELKKKYPELNLIVMIGSVRDSRRINYAFEKYRPDVVFHAAAHKHVPLMEDSPCEAVKNNAMGTYKTAYAAMRNGCKRFVLISTDKAVNPTNIMGASKRLCEMIIQAFDRMIKAGTPEKLPELFIHCEEKSNRKPLPNNIKTEFVAVRFGNVLGSSGSVIPLFKKQIAAGGPVTVTHPEIIRYFMTIPEAVSLVLQAEAYAKGGEIFVFDMGSPVKIDTLARNLIKLSGYKPDEDIKVVYTGLRPGEKLYEEKLMAEEGMKKTPNNLIHIGSPIDFNENIFLSQLEKLMLAAYENHENIKEMVEEIVLTYHHTVNKQINRPMGKFEFEKNWSNSENKAVGENESAVVLERQ